MRDLQDARGAPLIDSPEHGAAAAVDSRTAPVGGRDRRYVRWLAGVAALVIAADLATKTWVVEGLGESRVIRLLGGYLELHQTRNAGAAFGIATGATILLSVVAAIVIIVIIRTSRHLGSLPWSIVLGLLLGGAAGNLADRVFRSPGFLRGHVVDWIDFGPGRFPLFNAADSAIVVGGGLAVLLAVRGVEIHGQRSAPVDAAPEGSAPEGSAPEGSAPEATAPEVSAPEATARVVEDDRPDA